jgi:hypothetical protein
MGEGNGVYSRDVLHRSSAAVWLPRTYLILVTVFASAVCGFALREHRRIAYIDDWRILHLLFTQPLEQWLFAAQNGHRVPGTLMLYLLDYHLFGGEMRLLVVASFVCAGLAALVLLSCFRAQSDLATPVANTLLAFVCFLLFWSNAQYNFLWGVCQCNLLATLWLVLALWAGIRHREIAAGGSSRTRLLLVATAAAFLATFAHGGGIAAWAALLATAATGRIGWRASAALAAGAALTIVLYSSGQVNYPDHGITSEDSARYLLSNPVSVLNFAAALLGLPAGTAAQGFGVGPPGWVAVSTGAGTAGLAVFALLALPRLLGRVRSSPLDQLAVGLMSAGIGFAAVICIVRLPYFKAGTPLLNLRFLSWSTLFWMGIACAIPGLIGRRAMTARACTPAAGTCLAVSLLMLPGLSLSLQKYREARAFSENAALVLLLGAQDDIIASVLAGPKAELVPSVAERLHRDGTNLFADARRDLAGTLLGRHFEIAPLNRCRGAMKIAKRTAGTGSATPVAVGWVLDAVGNRTPRYLAIADSAGVIRGLGNLKPSGRLPRGVERGTPWSGYISEYDVGERYTAYGVLADGRSACRLQRAAVR